MKSEKLQKNEEVPKKDLTIIQSLNEETVSKNGIVAKSMIKLPTIGKDLSKSYFIVLNGESGFVLIIKKYLLLENIEDDLRKTILIGFTPVKLFKNKVLLVQTFSITLSTLNSVMDWIKSIKI